MTTSRIMSGTVWAAALTRCPLAVMDGYPVEERGNGVRLVIDYDLQHYVPVPATGAKAVTEIDLTVRVRWMDANANGIDAPDPFVQDAVYQAEITLTAVSPYTFDADSPFAYITAAVESLDGENSVPGTRVLTAAYLPADMSAPISGSIDLTNLVPVPVMDKTAVQAFGGPCYEGEVMWLEGGAPLYGPFKTGRPYMAVVTLTAAPGYYFADSVEVTHDDTDAPSVSTSPNTTTGKVSVILAFTPAKFAVGTSGLPNPNDSSTTYSFSSAIEMIKAAAGRTFRGIRLEPGDDPVTFGGDDLSSTGLVLTNNGSSSYDADNNSPAYVTIDGGGRVVDLTGSVTGKPLITVRAALC